MNLNLMDLPDLVGLFLGLFFTLSIFSYLLGDNFLFRLAIHIFIGVAGGYAAVMAFYNVIWPHLILPLLGVGETNLLLVLVPLVLGLLLLFKALPRMGALGGPSVAYLVGAGAAVAIGGAVLGTIFPQSLAAMNLLDLDAAQGNLSSAGQPLVYGALILLGTVTSLAYFHFGAQPSLEGPAKRNSLVELAAWIGQIFIAITLGTLFAGVLAAGLAALIERWNFLLGPLLPFIRS